LNKRQCVLEKTNQISNYLEKDNKQVFFTISLN
jgi:hypothetical protein